MAEVNSPPCTGYKRLTSIALFLLAIVVAAMFTAELMLNPWRSSDAIVRTRLLAITPLGSRLEDVRSILDQNGWHEPAFQQTRPAPAHKPFLGGAVGGYQGLPWYTTVRAFWEFDDDSRLRRYFKT